MMSLEDRLRELFTVEWIAMMIPVGRCCTEDEANDSFEWGEKMAKEVLKTIKVDDDPNSRS